MHPLDHGHYAVKANFLAMLANDAYSIQSRGDYGELRMQLERAYSLEMSDECEDALFIDRSTGTEAFLAFNDRHTIVAIKGTFENKEWLKHIDFRQTHFQTRGRVHMGFDTAARAIRNAVQQALRKFSRTGSTERSIWFTGHSMGGSLAILLSHYARLDGISGISGIYTFGAPKVGDKKYVRFYPHRGIVKAFACPGDPFPWWPPHYYGLSWPPYVRYAHVTELDYLEEGETPYSQFIPPELQAATSLFGVINLAHNCLQHKLLTSYIPQLRSFASRVVPSAAEYQPL